MKERVKIMNMKWMSLVAVMAVFSAGCSESEQESAKQSVADEAGAETQAEVVEMVEEVIVVTEEPPAPVKTAEEKKAVVKEILDSVEGIPPEKLDSEVKGLVEKISENSDMSEEEAAKLEQDLKGVFQKIEAERQSQ